tara:strand:+ start:2558 stop:3436 length:879 start_codon:yes stop_codon:yes gene_type:complete
MNNIFVDFFIFIKYKLGIMKHKQNVYINFGKIKTVYYEALAESISNGNKKTKSVFKDYINLIKENEALKTQFYIFNNIENKIEGDKDKAIEFVKENISLMNKFSKKEISEANTKLGKFIIEGKDFDSYGYSSEELKELHKNVSKLINTKKTTKTVGDIVEVTHKVAEYIVNNAEPEKEMTESLGDTVLSNKDLSAIMVSKFNKEYGKSLSESEVSLLNDIIIYNSDEVKKEEIFKESVSECLALVNGKLENADADLKMSLLNLKENLLDKKYNNDSFEIDVLKLNDLKSNLR